MTSDEFDRVEFLEKQKTHLEIKIDRLDFEIEEVLPEIDRSDSWERSLRNQREEAKNELEQIESDLLEALEEDNSADGTANEYDEY
ncbi:hypothetical protein [Natrinema hispanicum]|uniref:Uncharacterized protein n=1 Tax=Natrinema hispanicum TaxID=392421 RepID=A0A1I0IX53_9EURY|nr:hypothetical protein [Natrinema hispanicum]SEU01241.1 hypothetical protein SAMN04488694_12643 [Natrinema hispanicum]